MSLSPHDFIGKIDEKTTVVAVTGVNDGNTEPVLARDYVASLKGKGIDATYIEVPGVGHNGIEKTSDYKTAINQLLKGRSQASSGTKSPSTWGIGFDPIAYIFHDGFFNTSVSMIVIAAANAPHWFTALIF